MLAPDSPKDRIQFIDARDLAAFALHLGEYAGFAAWHAASGAGH
jgi:hypothetical protein